MHLSLDLTSPCGCNTLLALPYFKADCGSPPSPRNGHLLPHNSTLEGAEVTYVCWNVHQEHNTSLCTEIYTKAVCNEGGIWEPKSDDTCSIFSGKPSSAMIVPLVPRPIPSFSMLHTEKVGGAWIYYTVESDNNIINCYNAERSFEPLSGDAKIAVASSIIVFVVTAVLFFTVGFLSGCFCHNKKKKEENISRPEQMQTPYYDDVVLQQREEQGLELKDNVAYAPVRMCS